MTARTATMFIAGLTLVLIGARSGRAQGCVAVRPMACATSEYIHPGTAGLAQRGEWQLSSSYQYFRSFRHFRGDQEEIHRVEEGTEVINVSHATDFGVGYGLTERLALTLNIPLLYYDRSSLYEHYGNSSSSNPTHARFHTGSMGLGDLRLSANYWAFDPITSYRGNVAFGLGIKAPTGDSDVRDTFHKLASDGSDSTITKAVDQSIQLGDGGWGFTVQTEGYRRLFAKTSLYFNGFYLFNPKEVNDVPYSVADQFFARMGLNYAVMPRYGLSASLGGRWEGIPVEDRIGGSEGRRRPGHIVSIEPGVSYQRGSVSFALSVPVALYRNRTQSVSDKQRTAETGVFRQGDAAFADYLINFTISTRLGPVHSMIEPMEGLEE